ncbi:MAG TPA: 2OG-Fe(II) oxygenase [Thermoanaerobaculia bacterium]|nr:2OG-Fe(II) oxygenase [Thermoanaerobaculia bacterium]
MSTTAAQISSSAVGQQIAARLREETERLRAQWNASAPVRHFFLDDLLPHEQAIDIYRRRPHREELMHRRTLREHKWVGVALERYDPSIGAHLLAFQEPEVVAAVAAITGIRALEADPTLYASGISVMEKGDFLNPHLDNSHDGDQTKYRVLNLLFYISPEWKLANGGNLELWTPALDVPHAIESRFNRLVVMATDDRSWHSVRNVVVDAPRVCLSNYYFSALAPGDHEYRNVTSFRGRPEERVKRTVLRADSMLLNAIGRVFPFLLRRNPHRRKE